MELVKAQWTWYVPKDATWERGDDIRVKCPHLSIFLKFFYEHVYMIH
jgi:hypothetical protein